MNMTIASAPPVQPVVEDAGFKLVEEDDVAFAVSLCREIHRIYSSYQAGDLTGTSEVRAGLLLTWDMLSSLQSTVVDGMPALRIRVAAAQTMEMASVLFGQMLTPEVRGPGSRLGPAAPSPAVPPPAIAASAGSEAQASPQTADTDQETASKRPAWFFRQALAVRVAIALVLCCVAGAIVDLPFVVMALFPSAALQLAVVFFGTPIVIWAARPVWRGHHNLSI